MKKSRPKNNFLPVPHELVEQYIQPLGNAAFVVFIILLQLAHRFGDEFYHSDNQIAEKYSINLSMLRRARVKLKKVGFVSYRSGSNINSRATVYRILPRKELYDQFRMSSIPKTDRGGDQDE